MRITNSMLATSFLADMNRNLKNMSTIQEQMTSGKEVSKPSDDPVKVTRSMRLNSDIYANEQYKTNIEDTSNFLDSTDTALGQLGAVLSTINERLISAGNAAYGSDERKAIKNAISEQIGHFGQIMNTSFDGKYLFGGTRTTSKPITVVAKDGTDGNNIIDYAKEDGTTPLSWDGTNAFNSLDNTTIPANTPEDGEYVKISGKINVEISQGVVMDYNVGANNILEFKDKNGVSKDLRQIFNSILDDLDNNNPNNTDNINNLITNDLDDIQAAVNNVLKVRAEVGAKQNRMEDAKSKNVEDNFNLTEILSKTEDIDIAEKTMQFATLQTVYTASLQTSAKVIQPSILDYLR